MEPLTDIFGRMEQDPDFLNLNYREQVEVRAAVASKYASEDQEFLALPIRDQQQIFDSVTLTRPALRDKNLQEQAVRLVQAAQRGDESAKKIMSGMVAQSSLINNSIIAGTFGTKIIAPAIADEKNVARTPELESSQFWAADNRSRAILSDWFETELSTDAKYSQRTRNLKILATVLPTIAETLLLTLPTVGTSAAPVALGRLAMSKAVKLGTTAAIKGSAWGTAMAGLLGGVTHASLTASIGVVRENVLEMIKGNIKNEGFQETLKKNAKWFGGYFLWDVVGNLALDTMLPMLKGTSLAFLPKKLGQNAAYFKGLSDKDLTRVIGDFLDGKDIDPYLAARLTPQAQLALDNLKVARAVHNNLPSANKHQIFSFLANTKGYVANPAKDGSSWVGLRATATTDAFIKFRTPEAGIAWLVNNWDSPGAGRALKNISEMKASSGKLALKGTPVASDFDLMTNIHDAKYKLSDFTYDGVPLSPANMSLTQWRDYVRTKNTFSGRIDQRLDAFNEFGNDYFTKKYGVDALKDKEKFVEAVLRRNNLDPEEVDVIWSGGGGKSIATARVYALHGGTPIKPGAKYALDFTGSMPGAKYYDSWKDQLALTVEHEVEHLTDGAKGWSFFHKRFWGTAEPHHAEFYSFDIDALHKYSVQDSLANGYLVKGLEKAYPELIGYQFRPVKPAPVDLPTYTAASRRIELQRVLRSKTQIADDKHLAMMAKLVSPDPQTGAMSRENVEKFCKEYMRASGADQSHIDQVSVRIVHSEEMAKTGELASHAEILGDKTLQFRYMSRDLGTTSDTLVIPYTTRGRDYINEIMDWLDNAPGAYPVKPRGNVELRTLQKASKWKLGIMKTGEGTWAMEAQIRGAPYEFGMLKKTAAGWEVDLTRRTFNKSKHLLETQAVGPLGTFQNLKQAKEAAQIYLQENIKGVYAKGKLQDVLRRTGTLPRDVYAGLSPTDAAREWPMIADELSTKLFGEAKKLTKTLKELGFGEKYPKLLGQQKIASPAWVDYTSKSLYGTVPELDTTTNKWIVDVLADPADPTSAVAQRMVFESHDEVALRMIADTVDDNYMKAYLNEIGMSMRKNTKTGMYEIVSRVDQDKVLFSGPSAKQILMDNKELMPKIPHDLGPTMSFVAPNIVEVKYAGGAIIGSPEEILKEFDRFANRTVSAMKRNLGATKQGYLIGDQASQTFEVFVSETGDRMVFNTIEEAKAWLKGGFNTLESIENAALKKGQRIWAEGGKWIVYDSKGTAQMFNTMADVKGFLAKAPIPEWWPELSGLPSELVEPSKKLIDSNGLFPPVLFELKPNQTKFQLQMETFNQFISSPEGWLTRHVDKGGASELLRIFRRTEDIRQLIRGQDNRLNQIAHTLFLDESKKSVMKLERRKYIGEWMRAKGDEAKRAVIEARNLTEYELGVGQRVRELWGVKAGEGLHGRYLGLSGGTGIGWLEDYLPKLSKYYLSHKGMNYTDGSFSRFFKDVYGKNVPKDLDAFFMHQRVYDILTLLDEDDPLALLVKYGKIGNRKTLLGTYWTEAMSEVDKLEGVDPIGAARVRFYMGDVMGIPQSAGEVLLKNASLEALRKFGVNKAMGEDLMRFFMGVGYMSALGLRPMLAVRNMMQIWTTLAPSLGADGNKWVNWALKKIGNDKTGQVFDAFRAKGLFMAELPVSGGEVFDAFGPEGMVGKFLNAGMKWYRNSDEFSRAVAYWAARGKFESASKLFLEGAQGKGPRMAEDAFLEMSGLRAMDPTFIEDTLSLVRKGSWVSAADSYATKMTTNAMFPYWAGMSPMSFRGIMGKLFGMMGHYPVYYVENIRRAMKYGSPASKLAFMATWGFNSAALYGAFSMIGLKANDFLPWQPLQFVGGPYYQLANGLLTSMGAGYKGRQARAELFGLTMKDGKPEFHPAKGSLYRWFIPFGYEGANLVDAFKYAEQGNSWAALLSATGGRPTPYWTGEQ